MNDILRFRIFDKEMGLYVDPVDTDYYIDQGGSVILVIESIAKSGVVEFKDIDISEENDLYAVERCTGLRDKNGKLIYEGDVVHHTVGGMTCRIVFYRGAFCGEFVGGFTSPLSGWFRPDFDEVIGNIHEAEDEPD